MNIDFGLLIKILLPFHKRQPVRLAWLGLFSDASGSIFETILQSYYNALASLKINAQVGILENHLSEIVGQPCQILHFKQSVFSAGLLSETSAGQMIASHEAVMLRTQTEDESLSDYQIMLPVEVSSGVLAKATYSLETHRLAGYRYEFVFTND